MLPKKVKKGEQPKADTINAIIDEVNKLGKIQVSSGMGFRLTSSGPKFWLTDTERQRFGIVVDCGNCANNEGCESGGMSAPSDDADEAGDCSGGGESFDDNRYWVVRARITNSSGDGFCDATTFAKYAPCDIHYEKVVVTNLAESVDGTHNIESGTVVVYRWDYDDGTPPTRRYTMVDTATLTPNAVLVAINSNADGGGKYHGSLYHQRDPADPDVDPTTNASVDDCGVTDDTCLVVNAREIGDTTHILPIDSTMLYVGVIVDTNDDGTKTVAINEEGCDTTHNIGSDIAAGFSESDEAETTSWTRGDVDGDGNPVGLIAKVRVRKDRVTSDGTTLYEYTRIFQFDSCGKLYSWSAETREEIGTEPCPTPPPEEP